MATLQNFHAPFKSLNVLRFSFFFFSCCSDKNCKASKHLCFWVALIHQPERYVEATSKDTFMWVGQSNNVTTFIPEPKILSFLHEKNGSLNFTRKLWICTNILTSLYKKYCIIKPLNISHNVYSDLTSLEKVNLYLVVTALVNMKEKLSLTFQRILKGTVKYPSTLYLNCIWAWPANTTQLQNSEGK